MNENEIGTIILDCAFRLHKDLGPGLLESVYESILAHLLVETGLKVACQVTIPITYRGLKFDQGFVADIVVNNLVLVELKSVEHLTGAHKKQVLTYLKLSNLKLGYLINFGEAILKNGIHRVITGRIEEGG